LRKGVAEAIAKGLPPGEIAAAVSIPEPFRNWVGRSLEGQAAKVRSELLGLELPLELERLALREGPPPVSKEKPRKIIYAGDPAALSDLQAVAGDARVLALSSDDEILREVADADAVIGKITPAIVDAGKRLRWVHSMSAGVEQYLGAGDSRTPGIEALRSRPEVVLTNGRRCHGPNIADQVFAYLLAFTRGVKTAIEARVAPPASAPGAGGGNGAAADLDLWKATGAGAGARIDLTGKTLLVIGHGGIGSEVALRARAFGMKALATDPDVADDLRGAEVRSPSELQALLPAADVVVVACPLTPRTRGLFGAAQFAAMKKGAYFINIARGRIVDPDALLEALRSGRVAAAGLDVTEPEPLPDSSPLWKLENVIITPHSAGDADGSRRRVRLLVRENLRRFVKGDPLLNVVDKEKGY
jgi:phosphoglycerate dehydrogenase-like enzyme